MIHVFCLFCFRFHGQLNRDLPQHPSIFNFMSCLRSTVYQNAISTVAQVERGRAAPVKRTLAAQALHRKSEEVEAAYSDGLLSASEMLRQAAAHYNDQELHQLLLADAEMMEEEAMFPDDDEITISKYTMNASLSLSDNASLGVVF